MSASGWLGRERAELDECGSTNDEALARARAGAPHGAIVIARRQTAGRGREGRAWASPDGGLYLSIVLRPELPLADVPPLTLAIGVGACDAARAFGAPAELKWPNDLYVRGRKLAGVLVDAQSQGGALESAIAGIGVNLAMTPDPVAATGISLVEASGRTVDRDAFVTELLAQLERWIDRYVAGGIAAIAPAWRARMARGLRLRAAGGVAGSIEGELAGLDLDGALLVRDDAGTVHRVRSGDVEVVRAPALSTTMSQ